MLHIIRTLSCKSVDPFLWNYAAYKLDEAERSRVEAHLRQCPNCAGQVQAYRKTVEFMQNARQIEVAGTLGDWTTVRALLERNTVNRLMQTRPRLRPTVLRSGVSLAAVVLFGIALVRGIPFRVPIRRAPRTSDRTQTRAEHQALVRSNRQNGTNPSDPATPNALAGPAARPIRNPGRLLSAEARQTPSGVRDDLDYINAGTPAAMLTWSQVGPDEIAALRKRIDATTRQGDDFIAVSWPQIANLNPSPAQQRALLRQAAAEYRRQKEIVDTRLAQNVSLGVKGASFSDFCRRLSEKLHVEIGANRGIADEKVTVFCENLPVRDAMRAVTQVFGYRWLRSGEENAYRYELCQDLRSRLTEEELRNRDLNEALLALDAAMQQRKAKADQEKESAPEEWALTQLYARLSAADRAALLNGQRLLFRSDSADPARKLPDDLKTPILQTIAPFRVTATGQLVDRDGQGTAVAAMPGAKALVQLHIAHTDLGTITLQQAIGFRYPLTVGGEGGMGGEQGHGNPLATGHNPLAVRPDNAGANRALRNLPEFTRLVSLQPESSCPRLQEEGTPPDKRGNYETEEEMLAAHELPPMPHVTSADVWEEVHKKTKLPIVADYYTHLYAVSPFAIRNASLFEALCKVGDNLGARWRKSGDFLLSRAVSYYWDKQKEVPNRFLARWQEDGKRTDGLPFEDIMEMAALSDAQLDSLTVSQGIRHCLGLNEWGLLFANNEGWRDFYLMRRNVLRTMANMQRDVREAALSPEGLEFDRCNPVQQQEIVNALENLGFSYKKLVGSHVRVEYVPSGRYVWNPRRALEVDGTSQSRLPLIQGRNPDEVLRLARQADAETTESNIHRSSGILAVTVTYGKDNIWGFGKPMFSLH